MSDPVDFEHAEDEMLRNFLFADARAGGTEALRRLQRRRERLDMTRVGIHDRGIRDIVIADRHQSHRGALVAACAAYCCAQALNDNISITEEGLTLRELNPQLDSVCQRHWMASDS
jgi:hypothetical protein